MDETQSPLTRLVFFIIYLALAASIIAGVYYFAVELPAQKAIQEPENSWCSDQCNLHYFNCVSEKGSGATKGTIAATCTAQRDSCVKECENKTYPFVKTNP